MHSVDELIAEANQEVDFIGDAQRGPERTWLDEMAFYVSSPLSSFRDYTPREYCRNEKEVFQRCCFLSVRFDDVISSPSHPPFLLSFSFPSSLQKMSQEFEIKRLSLEEQRDRLQHQLDNLKEELSAKLNMANQEVKEHVGCLESGVVRGSSA